jgi:hypothetical protein
MVVAGVLVALRHYAFGGLITNQHADILSQWLPFHCFLGKSLARGQIPAWNPFAMGGVPFAADPQSGWMNLPAMLLYTVLPCHVAVRWYLVLQPMVAGLALYGFLRSEGLARPAATAGGLALALAMAGSVLSLEYPFAAVLAWTAVVLLCASRMVRADRWWARILWCVGLAVAWGQVATVHLSDGLVVATGALVVFLGVRLLRDVRTRARPAGAALALAGLALASLAVVNLAVLVPRLSYLSRSSLGLGYPELDRLSIALGGPGTPTPPVRPASGFSLTELGWPLGLGVAPGAYVGAATLTMSLAAWWTRRHRALVWAFTVFGALAYLLSLKPMVPRVARMIHGLPLADFYSHAPYRLRFGTFLAIVVLAAIGLDAWFERHPPRERGLMLAPGLLAWWIVPALAGFHRSYSPVVLLGAVAGAGALAVTAWRPQVPWLRWSVPGVVLLELAASAVVGSRSHRAPPGGWLGPNLRPSVDAAAYDRPTAFVRMILTSGGRYATLAPRGQDPLGRRLLLRSPTFWGLVGDQRSMLFGLDAVDGYNPVQLRRYWMFVRTVDPKRIKYNAAFFRTLPAVARDLLNMADAAAPATAPPPAPDASVAARDGPWALYRMPDGGPMASVVGAWDVVHHTDTARRLVTGPGFAPKMRAVLDSAPPGTPTGGVPGPAGTASYRRLRPQAARVDVTADRPAVVLIRTPFDPGWHARLDGREVPIIPADYVDQGVLVPAGRHTLSLTYHDPAVGAGLIGSAAALAALVGLSLFAWTRSRRRWVSEGSGAPGPR